MPAFAKPFQQQPRLECRVRSPSVSVSAGPMPAASPSSPTSKSFSVHQDEWHREVVPWVDPDGERHDLRHRATPTVASAAYAVATARCNRIVREAAPWWLRAGAYDASSVLITHLKEIYEQLRSQHCENELTREEIYRLRDRAAAADAAATAAIRAHERTQELYFTADLLLKKEKYLRTSDIERVETAELTAKEDKEALIAAVLKRDEMQKKHDEIRVACDRAYSMLAQHNKKDVLTHLKAVTFQRACEEGRDAAIDRAEAAEAEAERLDSVDVVNRALVNEVKLLHIELDRLRQEVKRLAELANAQGNATNGLGGGGGGPIVFETDNNRNHIRPRITTVSVLTNMYKKHRKLDRRNTPNAAHNEQLLAELESMGMHTPAATPTKLDAQKNTPDYTKAFPADEKKPMVAGDPMGNWVARARKNVAERRASNQQLLPAQQEQTSGCSKRQQHHDDWKPLPRTKSFRPPKERGGPNRPTTSQPKSAYSRRMDYGRQLSAGLGSLRSLDVDNKSDSGNSKSSKKPS